MDTEVLRTILTVVMIVALVLTAILFITKGPKALARDKRILALGLVMGLSSAAFFGVAAYGPVFSCEKAQQLTSGDIPPGKAHNEQRAQVARLYAKETRNPVPWDCPLPRAHKLANGTVRFTGLLRSEYPDDAWAVSLAPPPLNRVTCTANAQRLRQGDEETWAGEVPRGAYPPLHSQRFFSPWGSATVECFETFASRGDGASISTGPG